jgi:hypothetical protein
MKKPSKPTQTTKPQARGVVDDDITVDADHIAVYNNMEVPADKTVEVEGLLIDPGWN